jgi:hypothetical protein
VAFGDSLLHESRDQLAVLVAGRASLETHTRPMTAPCDWRAEAALVAATRPDIVVIEFSGNALTPCMRRPDGSALTAAARADHYRLDLTAMVDAFTAAGASVLLVDAPRGRPGASRGDQFDGPEPFTVPILHSIERRATRTGAPVVVVPAARSVLTRAGDWTATLPCRAVDRAQGGCTGGRATVRAPDGAHFCPAEWPDERGICPVWSPGAWRYAAAIAAAI